MKGGILNQQMGLTAKEKYKKYLSLKHTGQCTSCCSLSLKIKWKNKQTKPEGFFRGSEILWGVLKNGGTIAIVFIWKWQETVTEKDKNIIQAQFFLI